MLKILKYTKMVRKNYKWNISLEEGESLILNTIQDILKEKIENCINLDELSLLLNSRTKNILITNNKKQKQLTNFIKNNYGSILYFLEKYDNFVITSNNKQSIIKLNTIVENEWIFVESDE